MTTRPKYETADNRLNEVRAFPRIAKHFSGDTRLRYEKMPPMSFADAALVDRKDKVHAYIEYKKRNMVWGKYPTIMLSASKFLKLHQMEDLGVGAYFVVEDNEGRLYALDLQSPLLRMSVEWGGRTAKTRDPYDVETVCHFPITQFTEIP